MGACDAGIIRGFAQTDGPSPADDGRAFGPHASLLDSMADHRIHRGPQQHVLSCEAPSPRMQDSRTDGHQALLRGPETNPAVLRTH